MAPTSSSAITIACLTRTCRTHAAASLAVQRRPYSAPVDSIPASKQRFIPEAEGSNFPKGYLLGSAHAGVKASNKTRDDVCIIASEKLCTIAGFFTRNAFRAAPVTQSRNTLVATTGKRLRGVVINSGCANAVTGHDGLVHAKAMVDTVDELFSAETEQEDPEVLDRPANRTLVMSTGVIGQKLPIEKILNVLPVIKQSLTSGYEAWFKSAKAIMTTDTFPKLVTKQFTLPSNPSQTYTIAGISKGAGMIHPNLGTLLSVICTDASVDNTTLLKAGRSSTMKSFNAISIDGDTSTNDSVLVMANGAAAPPGVRPLSHDDSPQDYMAFADALRVVMSDLAQLVVRDGEGATKFITIRVRGTETKKDAYKVAETIARSPLVKTAMYGRDANWGRILCAIGNSGVPFDRNRVNVGFGNGVFTEVEPGRRREEQMMLVQDGQPVDIDEDLASQILEKEEINVYVDFTDGLRGAFTIIGTYWTCDFSHEYVTINGDYRT
ncbi:Arginine biosynthesis bifunctional protein ArgJ, mitochondrial [Sphaceloma murrayae]|uniref:Arginine biosynthesis bifunctional protein ArgJ, mitochondrial n=1 Tax=Sphaceloma murrayae TaxID=2082308 RepID=A0A2K1QKZ6_9PEZI|nr:Arginine biosynthesis bifunctional protein ArgJ, mitochondrial [Sphaceloma murrayae]